MGLSIEDYDNIVGFLTIIVCVLTIVIGLLTMTVLSYKRDYEEACKEAYSKQDELRELKTQVRSLLWCVVYQREKVKTKLHRLLDCLYRDISDSQKDNMSTEISERIKNEGVGFC